MVFPLFIFHFQVTMSLELHGKRIEREEDEKSSTTTNEPEQHETRNNRSSFCLLAFYAILYLQCLSYLSIY